MKFRNSNNIAYFKGPHYVLVYKNNNRGRENGIYFDNGYFNTTANIWDKDFVTRENGFTQISLEEARKINSAVPAQ